MIFRFSMFENAKRLLGFDLTDSLAAGEAVTSVIFTAPAGVTVSGPSTTATTAFALFESATPGVYSIEAAISTDAAQEFREFISLQVMAAPT